MTSSQFRGGPVSARLVSLEQLGEWPVLTGPDIAALLGVTEQRVRQLALEGMPRLSRGRYDLYRCVRWYVRHLKVRARSKRRNKRKEKIMRLRLCLLEIKVQQVTGRFVENELLEGRKYLIRCLDRHIRYLASDIGQKVGWSKEKILDFRDCLVDLRASFADSTEEFASTRMMLPHVTTRRFDDQNARQAD